MYDSIINIGEMLNPTQPPSNENTFRYRAIQTSKRRGGMNIPKYITSMNCDKSSMLIQHSINGSSSFTANNEMEELFISTKEANSIYMNNGGDPDSVARRLIASRDRALYLKALCSMLIEDSSLSSEISSLLHFNPRSGDSSGVENQILCLCHLRSVVSSNGNEVIIATKLTPLPTESSYITNKPVEMMPAAETCAAEDVGDEESLHSSTAESQPPSSSMLCTVISQPASDASQHAGNGKTVDEEIDDLFGWDSVPAPTNHITFSDNTRMDLAFSLDESEAALWEEIDEPTTTTTSATAAAAEVVQEAVMPPPSPPSSYLKRKAMSSSPSISTTKVFTKMLTSSSCVVDKKRVSLSYSVNPFELKDPKFTTQSLMHFLSVVN
jgi:hypothetical protein